jgi:iron complex outermembrane recepter protein
VLLLPPMRFYRLLLLFLTLATVMCAHAQTELVPIQIKIVSTRTEPVPFATIAVTPVADTSGKILKATDTSGTALFNLQPGQAYFVQVTSVNYKPFQRTITIKQQKETFTFSLQSTTANLSTVVVTATRPLTRQEDDKTIVDPEPLAAASTNAYEILEKTPGLFVDQDGNIYLSSMSPAKIYINGREMKMSTADVATMLKNLPPNAISKIEILRTPSAKYDASGNGGIVNIVLKKGVKLGLTGSVVAGLQQGTYGNQFAGLNLNNNTGSKSSYLNLNYSRRTNFEHIQTNRLFAVDSVLQQDARTKYPATNYFASYGISDSLNSRWYVDFAGSVNYQTFNNTTENKNLIKKISTGQTISSSLNSVDYQGKYLRLSNGITFSRKIDSASEWSNDFYYSYDRNRNNQQYSTYFYLPLTFNYEGFGSPNTDRSNFVFTSDLRKKLQGRLTIETGVKASFLQYVSEAEYFKGKEPSFVSDFNRTNTFRYNENINAAYFQGSKTFGKNVILKAGGRLENTNMTGHQVVPSDTSFDIHRTDFFPYLFLSKKVMTIAGYELRAYLVARRTIVRPVYEQLNPFVRYVDQYLSETGNPELRPQFTNNYEANISVNERPLFAVGVNNTNDIFSQVVYTSDTNSRQSYRTYDNLGKSKEFYLRGFGAIPPGKRYFFVLGGQYNHLFYDGVYENTPLLYKKGTWTLFTYHSLKFDKRSQLSVNGFLRLRGQQGFYELGNFGALNASVNRQFLKQKLTITLSANDILKTNKNEFTINQGSMHANGIREGDTQRFGVNVRYNFGIRKKEENNMFNVESPEKSN